MTPKQWTKYVKKLERKGFAICDGTTENMDMGFQIFYPLFILTGISIFMFLLLHWERLRNFILNRI